MKESTTNESIGQKSGWNGLSYLKWKRSLGGVPLPEASGIIAAGVFSTMRRLGLVILYRSWCSHDR